MEVLSCFRERIIKWSLTNWLTMPFFFNRGEYVSIFNNICKFHNNGAALIHHQKNTFRSNPSTLYRKNFRASNQSFSPVWLDESPVHNQWSLIVNEFLSISKFGYANRPMHNRWYSRDKDSKCFCWEWLIWRNFWVCSRKKGRKCQPVDSLSCILFEILFCKTKKKKILLLQISSSKVT